VTQRRQLAAILFSDLAGYTARMGQDEPRTIAAVQRSRREQKAQVEQFGGQWVQEVGDGALCTFPSTVDAVSCALEIQRIFAADPDVDLRIGIHEGDIVVSGSDVFGDGVNIASRIQELAPVGGIAVSAKVHDEIRNKPGIKARSLGTPKLKNVSQPIEVFALETGASQRSAATRSLPPRWGRSAAVIAATVLLLGGVVIGADTERRESLMAGFILELPKWVGSPVEQDLAFTTAPDGTRIAYATSGSGPPLVMVLGWMTHLELGLGSPTYDASGFLRAISEDHLYVRYDGRGSGLSDRDVADHSLEARVSDLEAVIDAAGLDGLALYGVSAGGPTAITYAARHPDRVTRIAFYGTFARTHPTPERLAELDAIIATMRAGWGADVQAYRNVFSQLLAPDYDSVQLRVMNEFLKVSNNGRDAADMMTSLKFVDVSEQAKQLQMPALVIHRRGDAIVPYEVGGRDLAALVPGARLVTLEGNNHADVADPALTRVLLDFFAEDLPVVADRS
jgi:class 3 adenylate cyclase/pimeloyl-ACP methyl ester carboxylesterase